MRKLIEGIVEFREKILPSYRETFARLAAGQSPDSLFIACSDSRVVPNLFASTNPGDLFVVRNVGNIIPSCGEDGVSENDRSEAAAIEFAVLSLKVKDIIICGHSECGAMIALQEGITKIQAPHLQSWLRHAIPALDLASQRECNPEMSYHNHLSQTNVLQQIDHLKSYSIVQERIKQGTLKIHGWWFDIQHADVYAFEDKMDRFVLIDQDEANLILTRIENPNLSCPHTSQPLD